MNNFRPTCVLPTGHGGAGAVWRGLPCRPLHCVTSRLESRLEGPLPSLLVTSSGDSTGQRCPLDAHFLSRRNGGKFMGNCKLMTRRDAATAGPSRGECLTDGGLVDAHRPRTQVLGEDAEAPDRQVCCGQRLHTAPAHSPGQPSAGSHPATLLPGLRCLSTEGHHRFHDRPCPHRNPAVAPKQRPADCQKHVRSRAV